MDDSSHTSEEPAAPPQLEPPPTTWLGTIRAALSGREFDYTTGNLSRAILLLAIPMVLEFSMESVFALCDADTTRELIRGAIEADADNVMTDLHVWKIGPDDFAAIISLGTRNPRPADYYKQLIGHVEELSHVSVEVNVIQSDDDEA